MKNVEEIEHNCHKAAVEVMDERIEENKRSKEKPDEMFKKGIREIKCLEMTDIKST